jgi:hypothetical protein
MPKCVTNEKLNEVSKDEDPDVAAIAQELVRARKALASYRGEIAELETKLERLAFEALTKVGAQLRP